MTCRRHLDDIGTPVRNLAERTSVTVDQTHEHDLFSQNPSFAMLGNAAFEHSSVVFPRTVGYLWSHR
jgi:hypothetical protein